MVAVKGGSVSEYSTSPAVLAAPAPQRGAEAQMTSGPSKAEPVHPVLFWKLGSIIAQTTPYSLLLPCCARGTVVVFTADAVAATVMNRTVVGVGCLSYAR